MRKKAICVLCIVFSIFFGSMYDPYRNNAAAQSLSESIGNRYILAQIPTIPPSRDKSCQHGERMFYFAVLLIVVGLLLTPIGIGIPILVLGKALFIIAIVVYLWQMATC